jgi:hypothetical protein
VPLASTEDVFRTLAGALGDRLSRMPDGETGERRRWIWWQRAMLERHPAMEVDRDVAPIEIRQWDGTLLRRSELFRLRSGVDPDAVDFPTGYAEAALDSWSRFDALRRAAVVPAGMRFQVCLPTPMSSAFMYVSPRSHDDYMRAYERALLAALREIVAKVPAADLSIQWDICQEVLVFETYFASRPADYKERVFALLARLGTAVPIGVELGYHLCYGGPPTSTSSCRATPRSSPRSARRSLRAPPVRSTSCIFRCPASATTSPTSLPCASCRGRRRRVCISA